jgi:PAS domain S-box-containing protein
MRPFITEASCLNCHASQGYKVGDIRGGISVMVPLAPIRDKQFPSHYALILGHLALWLIGIDGITFTWNRVEQSAREKIKARQAATAAAVAVQTIDGMMDAVVITDLEGRITHYNKALTEFFGWSEEILGESPAKLARPGEAAKVLGAVQECLEKGYERDISCVLLTKDLNEIPVLINATLMKDTEGHPTGTIQVIRDITATREAEEKLKESEEKLRLLAAQILTAQESERRRLSKDLHDDLGQSLLVMKMQLYAIERALPEDLPEVKRNCEQSIRYVEETVDNVRRLSRDLSPSLLEDLGLYPALSHLLEEFGRYNNLKISTEMDRIDVPLGQDAQILVYRVIQEILTNVGKHAQATQVSLTIKQQENRILFQIADNGQGFSGRRLSAQAAKDRGLGLATMHERVRMLGGELKILSEKGQGTVISFTVPLR